MLGLGFIEIWGEDKIMPTDKRKHRGNRGWRTEATGSQKKHRGKGVHGGKGYAGIFRHKKSYLIRWEPDHLGKRGFSSLKRRNVKVRESTVNVKHLERLAAGKKELDLFELGYDKVLGAGEIKVALTVKAASFTESAKEKIEEAGGKAVEGEEE